MWHLVGGGNNFPPTRHGLVGGGAWPPSVYATGEILRTRTSLGDRPAIVAGLRVSGTHLSIPMSFRTYPLEFRQLFKNGAIMIVYVNFGWFQGTFRIFKQEQVIERITKWTCQACSIIEAHTVRSRSWSWMSRLWDVSRRFWKVLVVFRSEKKSEGLDLGVALVSDRNGSSTSVLSSRPKRVAIGSQFCQSKCTLQCLSDEVSYGGGRWPTYLALLFARGRSARGLSPPPPTSRCIVPNKGT